MLKIGKRITNGTPIMKNQYVRFVITSQFLGQEIEKYKECLVWKPKELHEYLLSKKVLDGKRNSRCL